jgi:hypothetical protein
MFGVVTAVTKPSNMRTRVCLCVSTTIVNDRTSGLHTIYSLVVADSVGGFPIACPAQILLHWNVGRPMRFGSLCTGKIKWKKI